MLQGPEAPCFSEEVLDQCPIEAEVGSPYVEASLAEYTDLWSATMLGGGTVGRSLYVC